MNCNKCGNQLEAGAKFCGKCGAPVENTSTESTNPQTTTPVVPAAVTGGVSTPQPVQSTPGEMDSFKVIFKSAWDNFKSKFWKLILLQLLMMVPLVVVGLLIAIAMAAKVDFQNTPVLIVSLIVGFGVLTAMIYWFVWTQAAMIQMLMDNPVKGIKETLREVKPKLRNYFLAGLLTGLIILGGFVLLVIPAFIFAVMYGYSSYIALLENKRPVESLKQSRAYVKGRFWQIVGRFSVFFLALIGASIVVGIIDGILGLQDSQVFSNIFSFITTPLSAAFMFSMYLHTKKAAGEVSVS